MPNGTQNDSESEPNLLKYFPGASQEAGVLQHACPYCGGLLNLTIAPYLKDIPGPAGSAADSIVQAAKKF